MKMRHLLSLLVIVLTWKINAQTCSMEIPADAIIVADTISTQMNEELHWVCAGGLLIKNGNEGIIILEDDGQAAVIGNRITVYLRAGAKAEITGNENVIFVDKEASISLTGNDNEIHVVPGGVVDDNGSGNTFLVCASLFIDYTSAPSSGCPGDPTVPQVSFETAAQEVDEAAGAVDITVIAADIGNMTASVSVGIEDGTATRDIDYRYAEVNLAFDSAVSEQSLTLTIIDDEERENDETIIITLRDASSGVQVGQAEHVLTIKDNDEGSVRSCIGVIPATAILVSEPRTQTGGNEAYWICNGGNLTLSGGNSTIFVESGGFTTVTGNEDTIFVSAGGNAIVTGNDNVIFVAEMGIGVITGNDNTIISEGGAIITMNGLNNNSEDCLGIDLNYNQAPSGGCVTTGSHSVGQISAEIALWPNPARQFVQVTTDRTPWSIIRLYDAMGQLVKERAYEKPMESGVLSLLNLPPGRYQLVLNGVQGRGSKALVVH